MVDISNFPGDLLRAPSRDAWMMLDDESFFATKMDATVDGWNPAHQLIWRISHYLQGFRYIPGGCAGFLNHQQYDSNDIHESLPPGSLTVRPWKYIIRKGKVCLPTIHFSGAFAVKRRGCGKLCPSLLTFLAKRQSHDPRRFFFSDSPSRNRKIDLSHRLRSAHTQLGNTSGKTRD